MQQKNREEQLSRPESTINQTKKTADNHAKLKRYDNGILEES